MNFESEQIAYFGDGLVTNYQYAWLDKAFDKLLEDTDYSNDKAIYLPLKEYGIEAGTQFDGNTSYYRVGWFEDEKKRDYYDYGMSGWSDLNLRSVSYEVTWFPYAYLPYGKNISNEDIKSEAYLCFVPYYEELGVEEKNNLEAISDYYYVGKKKEAKAYRGEIDYYPLKIKDFYIDGIDMGTVINEMRALVDNDEELVNSEANGEHTGSASGIQIYSDLQASRIIAKRVKSLSDYRLSNFLVVDELNEEARKTIEPMDSVHIYFELYDSEGKRIVTSHDGEEVVVKVGVGELLEEIDNALIGMDAGDVSEVTFTVPDQYPELEIYSGQKVTAKIMPQFIACRLAYSIDNAEKEELISYTEAEVEDTFILEQNRMKLRKYILDNKDSLDQLTDTVDEESLKAVHEYYYEYLEKMQMTKEDFCKNVLGASVDEYEAAIAVIAGCSEY